MYWDGQPVGTFAQSIDLATGLTTQIGSSDPDTTTEGWIGGIDEVALYGATLSADAILAHYTAMVAGVTQAPTLSYSRSGNQLTLSWPQAVNGFTLESSASLRPASWTAVSGVSGNSVTITMNDNMRFYRLKK
jgi:hypothetical protein